MHVSFRSIAVGVKSEGLENSCCKHHATFQKFCRVAHALGSKSALAVVESGRAVERTGDCAVGCGYFQRTGKTWNLDSLVDDLSRGGYGVIRILWILFAISVHFKFSVAIDKEQNSSPVNQYRFFGPLVQIYTTKCSLLNRKDWELSLSTSLFTWRAKRLIY